MNTRLKPDNDQLTVERGDVREMYDHLDQARESLLDFVATAHNLGPSDPLAFERFAQIAGSLSRLGHFITELLHSDSHRPDPAIRAAIDMIDQCVIAQLADDGSQGDGFRDSNLKVITQQTNNIRGWLL